MIELIQEHDVREARETGDDAEVRLVAGGEDEARFLTEKLGELRLELFVQVERPIEEPAAGATRTVALERPFGGEENFRMVRESEVVVRPHHDPPRPSIMTIGSSERGVGLKYR